jgi:hypothetical protein
MRYLFVLVFLSFSLSAQTRGVENEEFSRKFQDLEKLKLLEILDMEEETAIVFFTRRNKMRKNVRDILEKGEKIHEQMEKLINTSDENEMLGDLISQSLNIEK